ncbi:DEAD/DEAH box helicase [Vibrio sp.]|uniref:DEAD/DEAH box helicase n=1 Tax=Vibrio sp. TaxID=678 RepID=UPI003D14DD2C
MCQPFIDLGLSATIAQQLQHIGFQSPTEIQSRAIPAILSGDDLLACAQTGTGKTAAFGLPLIQKLLSRDASTETVTENQNSAGHVFSLILVPTRELAQQVFDNLCQYSQGQAIKVAVVYGGTSMRVQTQQLKSGVDILVATPGRLLDHLHCRHVSLKQTEYLVFDEADRMLDMGFMPDIQRITKRLPAQRQTLLFSATLDNRIKALAHRIMNQPRSIEVSPPNQTAVTVKQIVYPVDKKRKRELLSHLIGSRNWRQVLVFTKTKSGSDDLAQQLKLDGIKAVSINGDKSQGARLRALDQFRNGEVRALIATDVAARGLDIPQLEQVVNFDMPYKAEDYIHRIGRTGRAGSEGLAVSLMCREEEPLLQAVERLLDERLPQEWLAGYEPGTLPPMHDDRPVKRQSRSAEKRKMKARLKIHSGRGKHGRKK